MSNTSGSPRKWTREMIWKNLITDQKKLKHRQVLPIRLGWDVVSNIRANYNYGFTEEFEAAIISENELAGDR